MSVVPLDLLITATEINQHHGVGILLERFFSRGENFATLRSTTLYEGAQEFGRYRWELRSQLCSQAETEERLRNLIGDIPIGRILCVPYYREDFIHGVLAQQITGAPLCVYLMDDQNIFTHQVRDKWVRALLEAATIRLGISPEMCATYTAKYGMPFDLLPPLLTDNPEPRIPSYWQPGLWPQNHVAMIGNVWSAGNFRQLRKLTRRLGLTVDWYGNGPSAPWLDGNFREWESDGIYCLGHLPVDDLASSLAAYPCILVPSGSLDEFDDNESFSRLSLPSRLFFLHSIVETPILVLGHEYTAAARFVRHAGTGRSAPYDPDSVQAALEAISTPINHQTHRAQIAAAQARLRLANPADWIWRKLAGEMVPAPFTTLFAPLRIGVEISCPPALANTNQSCAVQLLTRGPAMAELVRNGLLPDDLEQQELTMVNTIIAAQAMRGLKGPILLLADHLPHPFNDLVAEQRLYQVRDLPAWQEAQFPLDPNYFICVGQAEPLRELPSFEGVASFVWLATLPENSDLFVRLATSLAQLTQNRGLHHHRVAANLHPHFYWEPPAYRFLARYIQHAESVHLDDILEATDVWTMPQAAFDRHWAGPVGKSYTEFGNLVGIGLHWTC